MQSGLEMMERSGYNSLTASLSRAGKQACDNKICANAAAEIERLRRQETEIAYSQAAGQQANLAQIHTRLTDLRETYRTHCN
jgi:hypothetical protein